MDFDQVIVNSNIYNIYDNGFTDTVQGMPLRAAIRCIRFLSASRPNSLRSDSGLGGGSLPAPHHAVLLSIPRTCFRDPVVWFMSEAAPYSGRKNAIIGVLF